VIEELLSRYGHLAIFLLLFGAGVGVPLPEEPTQLAAGALAGQGLLGYLPAMVTCWLGIASGDLAWFLLAQRHGEAVLSRRAVQRILTSERRRKVEAHLSRHAFLTVMISRHLSGLRLAAFALAATHGVRWRTFLVADGLSALISVPLVVSAGYLGAHHLAAVHGALRRIELGVLAVAVVGGLTFLAVRRWRRSRRLSADAGATPVDDAARHAPAESPNGDHAR
jgi:membrane protein DedA with SNARE-associated domain